MSGRLRRPLREREDTVIELAKEFLAQVQQQIAMRTAVKHIGASTVFATTALIAILGGAVVYAQGQDKDKYSLRSPSGIAFSDFRGYEDWSVVSSARTEEVLKVIVANRR
jgi:hypothetical protein